MEIKNLPKILQDLAINVPLITHLNMHPQNDWKMNFVQKGDFGINA